jgi:hypothetical protein
MKNLITTLCLTIAVLLGSVEESFALPKCPEQRHRTHSLWLNCLGTFAFANGDKYVGEFKDGQMNG